MKTVAVTTPAGRSAVGTLIDGPGRRLAVVIDTADGFGALGLWAIGDAATIALAGEEPRVAVLAGGGLNSKGISVIEFVWADDIGALDQEVKRATDLLRLWSDKSRSALRAEAKDRGVTALAADLGITRQAVYKRLRRSEG